MDDLDAFIAGMERLEKKLADPGDWFAARLPVYLEMAHAVSRQTMIALRPVDADVDAWDAVTDEFCELLFARSITGGFELHYGGKTGYDREMAMRRGIKPGNYVPISYQDVLDWVNAGVSAGGKDITEQESARNRSPEAIACDVYTAIAQHRLAIEKKDYGRITQRLEEWVESRQPGGDQLETIIPAMLEAWTTALYPVICGDYQAWAQRMIAESLG
jgi:hypothetical protein